MLALPASSNGEGQPKNLITPPVVGFLDGQHDSKPPLDQ